MMHHHHHHHHRRHMRWRRRHGPRRLFLRVYLFGLLLLFTVAASAGLAWRLLDTGPSVDYAVRLQRYVDVEIAPIVDDPERLNAKLGLLHEIADVDLAVYRPGGERVASAGNTILEPLDQAPQLAQYSRHGPRIAFEIPLANGSAYVVGRYQFHGGAGWPLVALVVLFAMAVVSFPLARSIARPIERVTQAARAVGAGDLSARTGLDRGDEVGELARAFDDMAARLERMVGSERELLANVSHELRTPLARIRIALELAEEEAEPTAYREHLKGIAGDLGELEQLVDQVLMTARLDLRGREGGAPSFERAPLAIDQLFGEAKSRFGERHAGYQLDVEAAADLPEILGDRRMLRRVIDNLLDNAVKYSDPGPIELAAALEDGAIAVAVRDRGIGVAEDDLPLLFEPFFRSQRSRERGSGGVGLGLTLCRRVIEAHGGTIAASNRDGGGLEVRFRLPVA
jgi:signal transduction histidine kinase